MSKTNKFWRGYWTGVVVSYSCIIITHSVMLIISPPPEPGTETALVEAPVLIMNVSAYCAESCCCGKWADGITASGKPAIGKICAAPPHIPFGTVLDVEGYGEYVVEDRGGAIKGNKLDLLFSTHAEALEFGRKDLKVRIK